MQTAILGLTKEFPSLEILKVMEESRQGDKREGILLRQSRGYFQVAGMGHESISALSFLLTPQDYIFPYYRDRALCLARGLTTYEIALSFFARNNVHGGGRAMHGHYSHRDLNIFSVATPTASQCIPATGCAWKFKLDGDDSVAICCIGDAALRQGEYFEAIAFSIQENLPVIFVIEDNLYGISTCTMHHNPYRLNMLNPETYVKVNGRDACEVYRAGQSAIDRARSGGGPSVLWCEMDRLSSHTSSDDQRVYRSHEDLSQMDERDPVNKFAEKLIESGTISRTEWESLQQTLSEKVEEDYLLAEKQPFAEKQTLYDWLYAPPIIHESLQSIEITHAESTTMVNAINDVLKNEIFRDNSILMFGEDIEDPKGGVFGLTKGLSTICPKRVINSPLAEATIVGVAVGLAAAGKKPIFEIQFIDFILPAINQIMTQAATLRWRTCGQWTCPMVLMSPCGAYLPAGGPWHSQSNEGIWAHIPGLQMVCPSTPEDAAGLLLTAIHEDNPVLYLIPKHIFRKKMTCSAIVDPIPIGQAIIRKIGTDVTIVSWGNTTEIASEAAFIAEEKGVSVEIIDLRSLIPWDRNTVKQSLEKTGRLLVIEEDNRSGGFGQTIIAEIINDRTGWDCLAEAPRLLAKEDHPVPFAPPLEYASLPDVSGTVQVLLELAGKA
jgi:2-oxoisovalerate dehydrogenase E1 component